jgi:hypothetical protein
MNEIVTPIYHLFINSMVYLLFSIIDILKVIHDISFDSQESFELVINDIHLFIVSYGLILFWLYCLKQYTTFNQFILIQEIYLIRYIIVLQFTEIFIISIMKYYTLNYISKLMVGGTIASSIIKIGFIADYHHWKKYRLQSIIELIPPTKHICDTNICTICPCIICYEDNIDYIITLYPKEKINNSPCKHQIHHSCWIKWIRLKPNSNTLRCPLCMTQI